MHNSLNQCPVRLLVVIVLYKMLPNESAAFRTLRAAILNLHNMQAETNTLLYDNTPGGQDPGALPADVQYRADPDNGGLSKACNYALEIAHREGFNWLLSLNQDTSLPTDFLCKLCDAAMLVEPMHDVAAIAPRIMDGGRVVSPFTHRKHCWALMRNIPNGFVGFPTEDVYAINSAFTIKVSALTAIGGYDPSFILDFCDLVIGRRLHRQKLRVYVAGNIEVQHELSVFDLMGRTTPGRYDAIRRAEEAFYDEYLGKTESMVLMLRLLYRLTYTLWKAGATLPYFNVGARFLCRRLFWSRERRMENWEQTVRQRSTTW